jgi:hypothetical protein
MVTPITSYHDRNTVSSVGRWPPNHYYENGLWLHRQKISACLFCTHTKIPSLHAGLLLSPERRYQSVEQANISLYVRHNLGERPPRERNKREQVAADFSTLKMETMGSSETSVQTRPTRRHIPEDGFLTCIWFFRLTTFSWLSGTPMKNIILNDEYKIMLN